MNKYTYLLLLSLMGAGAINAMQPDATEQEQEDFFDNLQPLVPGSLELPSPSKKKQEARPLPERPPLLELFEETDQDDHEEGEHIPAAASSTTHNKTYACKTCDSSFSRVSTLRNHIIAQHLKLCPFSCSEAGCQYSATQESNVIAHIKRRHPNLDLKPIYPSEQEMRELEKQIEKHMVKIPEHKGSFKKRSFQSIVQDPKKKHACKSCDLSYNDYRDLKKHIIAIHLAIFPHKCPVLDCKFGSAKRNIVTAHIKKKHPTLQSLEPLGPSADEMLQIEEQFAQHVANPGSKLQRLLEK